MGLPRASFSLNHNMEIELQPKRFGKAPASKEDCYKVTIPEKISRSFHFLKNTGYSPVPQFLCICLFVSTWKQRILFLFPFNLYLSDPLGYLHMYLIL